MEPHVHFWRLLWVAVLQDSRFFLILIFKCVPMSYWKGRWRRLGDKVHKIPKFEFAGTGFWVTFWTARRSPTANGHAWCRGKGSVPASSLREPSPGDCGLGGPSDTGAPHPVRRDPEQVPFKKRALEDIVVKRGLSRTLGALKRRCCGCSPLSKAPGATKAWGNGWQGAAPEVCLPGWVPAVGLRLAGRAHCVKSWGLLY